MLEAARCYTWIWLGMKEGLRVALGFLSHHGLLEQPRGRDAEHDKKTLLAAPPRCVAG